MYFWNVTALADDLREGRTTQREKMMYLLAFVALLAALGEVSSYTCVREQVTSLRILQSLVFMALNIFGVIFCHGANRRGDNVDFITRFICISWPITMRLLAVTTVLLILHMAVYFYLFRAVVLTPGFDLFDFVVLCLFSAVYYLWVGKHIRDIASRESTTHASSRAESRMRHMAKTSIIGATLLGFIIGVVAMEVLSRPARRAYREMLQNNYVLMQSDLADKALKEGNDLRAMVHLWTLLDAGPMNGAQMFTDPMSRGIDDAVFLALPSMNHFLKQVVRTPPGKEDRPKAMAHGELAAVLEKLGYKDTAKEHYVEASRTLNISEDKARDIFRDVMQKRRAQE